MLSARLRDRSCNASGPLQHLWFGIYAGSVSAHFQAVYEEGMCIAGTANLIRDSLIHFLKHAQHAQCIVLAPKPSLVSNS